MKELGIERLSQPAEYAMQVKKAQRGKRVAPRGSKIHERACPYF